MFYDTLKDPHYNMATNFDIVSYAVKFNNTGLLLVRRLLKEALDIMDESPAYKKAISVSCASDLLSLSRPPRQAPVLTTTPGAFYIAGDNIDLFSQWARRLQLAHLTKSCVEIIEKWRNPAKQVSKCWSSFAYSLVDTVKESEAKCDKTQKAPT